MLAEALQIKGLKDQVITKLFTVYHEGETPIWDFWQDNESRRPTWIPNPATSINLAWGKLSDRSPLRCFLLDCYTEHVWKPKAMDCGEALDHDFLIEAYTKLADKKRYALGAARTVRRFLEHDVACQMDR